MDRSLQANWPEEIKSLSQERLNLWYQQVDDKSLPAIEGDLGWLEAVLVYSDYAFEWLIKQPQWVAKIQQLLLLNQQELDLRFTNFSDIEISTLTEYQIKQLLRHQRHLYSIACVAFQSSEKCSIRKVTFLQSQLARQLISLACKWSQSQLNTQYGIPCSTRYSKQELVIMLMGKLGGNELNFSSDIDLIFCYPEEGYTEVSNEGRSIENQQYFRRLAQKLVALLHETTADGFVYRVDMRLRPYGESGALTMSFDSMADYYLEQGREWERFAMIKADYFCQDQKSAEHLSKIIAPFSFRRYIDFSVLDSIRQLKQKITTDMRHRNLANDIKLGKGGIRELEFILQSLQLISGGRNPELQVKNWWQTIEALEAYRLLNDEDSTALQQAYEFLRRLENVLQIAKNEQTQQLPYDEKKQQLTAYAMGYSDWSLMVEQLDKHRSFVETFFSQLFKDPNQETKADSRLKKIENWLNGNHEITTVFEKEDKHDRELLQSALSFKQNFVNEKFAQRGQRRLNQIIPHLVINARKMPNALTAFERCTALMQSIGKRTAYFELLAENLPLLEHLVLLVSRSNWLVEQLKQYPSLLDELLFPANFGKILSKEDLQSLLQQALLRIEPENIEEQLLAIGRFKVASQFKIAAGFLNHRFHILEVTRQLTDVAELCLQALLRVAWREISNKHGVPPESESDTVSNFLILGYGKLGGHELGFGSDLDLVFLFRGDSRAQTNGIKPIDVSHFYTRLTQRLVHYLNTRTQQGIMYEVDTRLRPSGRSGLLVSEFNAFVEYQQQEAWTWEKQALVRARAVAGDESLAQTYREQRTQLFISDKVLSKDLVEMRQKMRNNLDRTTDELWDIKQGLGGLVDIEFLVQYWVLKLAQQGEELPDIYSNHYWLNWLEQNQQLPKEYATSLKAIYENYQILVNQKRLDMEPGIVEASETAKSQRVINAIWSSTFDKQALQ